jgi:homoserine O-acetyltransferase
LTALLFGDDDVIDHIFKPGVRLDRYAIQISLEISDYCFTCPLQLTCSFSDYFFPCPRTLLFHQTMSHQRFECELETDSGVKLPAFIAYKTLGDKRNPAVLTPTCYGGKLNDTSNMFLGNNDALSPQHYYVIIVGLVGGSESSSPSNQPAPYNGPNFPKTSYADNIRLQKALLDHLGVLKLFAYVGFSMGGQQAYHFATLYPDDVERIVVIASSARTSEHNWCFLEGPKAALLASSDFEGGHYKSPASRGTVAFSRVWSAWALSPEWFRAKCWEKMGFKSLEDYLNQDDDDSSASDANDLLQMLDTWQRGDISQYHGGDLVKALGAIKARCLIMPTRTDQYFRWEDSEEEVKHLKYGQLSVVETIYGHIAGGGGGPAEDDAFMNKEIKAFFASEVERSDVRQQESLTGWVSTRDALYGLFAKLLGTV